MGSIYVSSSGTPYAPTDVTSDAVASAAGMTVNVIYEEPMDTATQQGTAACPIFEGFGNFVVASSAANLGGFAVGSDLWRATWDLVGTWADYQAMLNKMDASVLLPYKNDSNPPGMRLRARLTYSSDYDSEYWDVWYEIVPPNSGTYGPGGGYWYWP